MSVAAVMAVSAAVFVYIERAGGWFRVLYVPFNIKENAGGR